MTNGCLEAENIFLKEAEAKEPKFERSGSCAVIILFVDNECFVANIGDSRAIMSADQGKRLFLLTRDHRPTDEMERKRIETNGGKIYQSSAPAPAVEGEEPSIMYGPHRVVPGRLSVSRTIGDIEAKALKYGGKSGVVIAQPEISQFTIKEDFHDFIVVGCDGIFDRLESQAVLDIVWNTINTNKHREMIL